MTFGNILPTGCKCGKDHTCALEELIVGSGVISRTPDVLKKRGIIRPFLLADRNTFFAAGEKLCKLLEKSSISYSKYVFNEDSLEPDESAVGAAVMHLDTKCDAVIAIGSGVIGDIAKILANTASLPYMIVATAPSMDGYASKGAALILGGMKVTKNAQVPT